MKHARGFTLIEMLVVVAVAGILVAYALPAWQKMVRSSRLTSEANQVLTSLVTVRSEAIKRSQIVTMCASANQTSCTTSSANWANGWIVFAPPTQSAPTTAPSAASIIVAQQALTNSNTLTAYDSNGNTFTYITYNPTGFNSINSHTFLGGFFRVCDSKKTAVTSPLEVIISSTGRPQVSSTQQNGTAITTCP